MKYTLFILAATAAFSSLGYASNTDELDTKNLTMVKENHATISRSGNSYVLDSYIVMFEQPYYITVKRADNKSITLNEAAEIAVEYIKPRGCTSPLSRRQDLDKFTSDKTQWLIGVEC